MAQLGLWENSRGRKNGRRRQKKRLRRYEADISHEPAKKKGVYGVASRVHNYAQGVSVRTDESRPTGDGEPKGDKPQGPPPPRGTDGEDNLPQLPCQKSAGRATELFPRGPNVETRGAHRGPSASLFRGPRPPSSRADIRHCEQHRKTRREI
ncbi:uncharacterized protein CLUP02_04126 [Colletotrichum lupini]|uniref:Uncharacterized protein n=1 Tax=Colletotrichum lupini TaxID=145971 RepID=A0A9Q8SJR9_9PEZI|nr:uncharacterized protein CLUP02_04126 [Colletotrichum lupini]UQC78649.1 hypothetical protein CLUP02_04126 [Colletotrichum lupini]